MTGLFCTYLFNVDFTLLETLDISGTCFSFAAFEQLTQSAPNLKCLKLNYASIVYNGLIHFAGRMSIDGQSASKFTQNLNLSKLEELELSANNFYFIASDVTILQSTPSLTKLNLANCTSMDKAFENNSFRLTKLVSLDLSRADISTKTLKNMLLNMPNLQTLNLSGCEYIDMANLELSSLLSNLKLTGLPNPYKACQAQKAQSSQASQTPSFWSSLFGGKKSSSAKSSLSQFLSRHEGNTYAVDTDTTYHPDKEFNLTRIFYASKGRAHPEPNDYRMSICNHVSFGKNKAFELKNNNDIQLQPVRLKPETKDVFHLMKPSQFYAKQTFQLDSRWQAIASLSASDEMTHYHTANPRGIEINYSARDNQYYIRSTVASQTTVTLDFLVQSSNLVKPALNEAIQTIVDQFLAFGIGKLKLNNGEDYLNAIMQQKVGSCRHRAVAFKLLLARDYPEIAVRIVSNDCHMFTEVKQGNIWLKCELGGYPANVVIHESAQPVTEPRPLRSAIHGTTPLLNSRGSDVSVEAMSEAEKSAAPKPAKAPTSTKSKLSYVSEQQRAFQRRFETWNTDKHPQPDNLHDYLRDLLHHEDKNHLIQLPAHFILNMNLAIQMHARNNSHPVFYIHSPDDVVCSAQYVKRQADETGGLCDGPGGLLHDFLTTARTNQDNAPILIVNYANFLADDIVRLNGLLDKERHADGTPLPLNTSVIGLIDPDKPGTYKGADFYSRFDTVQTCSTAMLPPLKPVLTPITEHHALGNLTVINLHHSSSWETQLMGGWIIKEGLLRFELGELAHALSLTKPIEIKNPPRDEAFELFWQQAALNQTLNDCTLYSREGYQWESLLEHVSWFAAPAKNARVLNPGRLYRFRDNYQFKNEHLNQNPGLLETNANQTLAIYVTRSLDDDQWALFLDESRKHKVTLSIACAPGVTLPDGFGQPKPSTTSEVVDWDNKPLTARTACLCSDNYDATVEKMTADMILDISECNVTDLLTRVDGVIKNQHFEFTQTDQAVKKALNAGRRVVLTGDFSDELLDNLAPLLRNRTNNSAGQLILVSKQPIPFMTTLKDNAVPSMVDEEWLDPCFSQLPYKTLIEPFDPATSWEETFCFIEKRKYEINEKLKEKPCVFISGLTGVGKSSFIQHDYIESYQCLHQGEKNSTWVSWACDDSMCEKILFIDEANLSLTDWSVFEGLFHTPRSILIDGQNYPLTEKHKVIFAGNPLNYGDDRRLATLFKRHRNALVFDPLPSAFLYERIIKPVFLNTTSTVVQMEKIAAELLSVYQFIVSRSTNEVLISPRDVQMMALLVSNYHRTHPDASTDALVNTAKFYARSVGMNLFPGVEQQFPPVELTRMPIDVNHPDFLYTESRAPVLQILNDLLSIRKHRRSQPNLNEAQCYGGLGGLILEGEPGIGKSEMVVHYLISHGFTQADFYRIPISMEFDAKKKLLMKAFHEGGVVMMDEINSAPMMEQLLNSLLMGQTLDGKRPENPGFMVIGTQNPSTMAGRRVASTALTRRMQTHYLAPYTETEMQTILLHKGLSEHTSRELVAAFQAKCLQAKTEHLTPAPVFRDLIKAADACIKAHKRAVRVEPEASIPVVASNAVEREETIQADIREDNINWSWRLQTLLKVIVAVSAAIAFVLALIAINAATAGSPLVILTLGSVVLLKTSPLILGGVSGAIVMASAAGYFYGLFSPRNVGLVEQPLQAGEQPSPAQEL